MDEVTPSDAPDGFGSDVLVRLEQVLEMEERFVARTDSTLAFWGHRLAQQIVVEPAEGGVRVHVATDLLTEVPDTPATAERVAALNRFAVLSALLWDPARGEATLHAAATLRPDNASWVEPLLIAAATVQSAQAHAEVDDWAARIGGRPAVSDHPENGARRQPAERLDVLATVYGRLGAEPTPFGERDLDSAAALDPAPWSSVRRTDSGLTATFEGPAGTGARLGLATETRHPMLGSGAHVHLGFTVPGDAARTAVELNLAEVRERAGWHLFGAWCAASDRELAFVTFLPAAVYEPGLLRLLCSNAAHRVAWAARRLAV